MALAKSFLSRRTSEQPTKSDNKSEPVEIFKFERWWNRLSSVFGSASVFGIALPLQSGQFALEAREISKNLASVMVSDGVFSGTAAPDALFENQIQTSPSTSFRCGEDTDEGADSRKPEYCP